MTTAEAEALIAKKQENAKEYLEMRYYRAQRHATRVLMRLTGDRSGVSLYKIYWPEWNDPRPEEMGINWSACGTQDAATAAAFAQALAECAKIAEDYNTERAELLEDLEGEAESIRKRATDNKEAEEK